MTLNTPLPHLAHLPLPPKAAINYAPPASPFPGRLPYVVPNSGYNSAKPGARFAWLHGKTEASAHTPGEGRSRECNRIGQIATLLATSRVLRTMHKHLLCGLSVSTIPMNQSLPETMGGSKSRDGRGCWRVLWCCLTTLGCGWPLPVGPRSWLSEASMHHYQHCCCGMATMVRLEQASLVDVSINVC